MKFQDVMSPIVTGILITGLLFVGIGFTLWIFEMFQAYDVSWHLQLTALGLVLLIFGGIATKLFQD